MLVCVCVGTALSSLPAPAACVQALQQQAEAQQGTPGRWGSLGRLISGGGRSPAGGGGGGGPDSRRSSLTGSPSTSPRFSGGGSGHPQQQLFGSPSPSRLGQQQQQQQERKQQQAGSEEGAGAAAGRRITVAAVQQTESATAAAAAAVLASKQSKAAAALLAGGAAAEQDGGPLIKAVGLAATPPAPTAQEQPQALPSKLRLLQPQAAGRPQEQAAQQREAQQEPEPASGGCMLQDGEQPVSASSDVETPLESPELSCIVADSTHSSAGLEGPAPEPAAAGAAAVAEGGQQEGVAAAVAQADVDMAEAGSEVQEQAAQPAEQPPQKQQPGQPPAAAAAQQQPAQVPEWLNMKVLVPAAALGRRGRGGAASRGYQELDLDPHTGTFSLPDSEALVDPLPGLLKVSGSASSFCVQHCPFECAAPARPTASKRGMCLVACFCLIVLSIDHCAV